MKKLFLFLFFVLFFCSFAYSAVLTGLDWDTPKFEKITDDESFILTIKSGETVEATDFTIKKEAGYSKNIFLIFGADSKLINKAGTALKIDSSITVIMNGASGSPAVIHARNTNLTIDANLLIKGNSIISSSGEDGNNGVWHGPKDEGGCGRCGNYDTRCSIDNDSRRATSGNNAGILYIKNVLVEADAVFSSAGGHGGNGTWGNNEGSGGQDAIRGGNGGKGGNGNSLIIDNLIAVKGSINLNTSGGNGGNGGKGGNNNGCGGAHDGGDAGNGGNSGEVKVFNTVNKSSKINITVNGGLKGIGGKRGTDDGGICGCNGDKGRNGLSGTGTGDALLYDLTGFSPWNITAKNIMIKAKPLGNIDFFPDTIYSSSETFDFTACRLGGAGMELSVNGNEVSEQIKINAAAFDVNVWNPLKFFDRVLFTAGVSLSVNKNFSCNLNPKYDMQIPFEGRIHNIQEGFIKDIKIVNFATGQTEFEDLSQKDFFNGFFSSVLNANLYSNTAYKIYFKVCNSNGSLCEQFVFDFFTWRRLW